MEKKQYLSMLAIVVLISFVVIFFREPVQSEKNINDIGEESPIEREFIKDEEEYTEIEPLEYINLQSENRMLKEEIERLENELFDSNFRFVKRFMNSDLVYEIVPYPESTEILYKEVEEDRYVLFYTDETGFNLRVSSLEDRITEQFYFYGLNPTDNFNWFGGGSIYNGFIGDNQIQSVRVIQNETVYDAKIITINENMRVWYSIIDYERKSVSEQPDKIRIEALNEEGEVIWQESFDGNLGG
ncbi:hypothetical protein [Evansella clarkii]|uniref:hypothetical protein n=1 Tax=Evansella clarkii TaxID=79879 RepID=UPI000B44B2DA|nr:hypothetical protein [Evansella clarkii]